MCQQQRKKVPFFRAAPKTTWTLTMPSRFADEDDDMQNLSQLPRPQDKLTPLPDFVTSYHNPPDEFGNNISNSMEQWIPLHSTAGKTSLTIAIGCTGGQHRSVAITEELSKILSNKFSSVTAIHRDIK